MRETEITTETRLLWLYVLIFKDENMKAQDK